MSTFIQRIRTGSSRAFAWTTSHKVWSAIIVVLILGGGYLTYAHYAGSASASQYVVAPVTRGTLTVTVTGSGQVAANQSLDLSPKASGQVTSVDVKAGDVVAAGATIASVDDTDAEKSLRDAETSLTSAQISYQQSVTGSEADQTKAEGDAFSSASGAVTDVSKVLKDLNSTLFLISDIPDHTRQQSIDAFAAIVGGSEGDTERSTIQAAYQDANVAYDDALTAATGVSPTSSGSDIQAFVAKAYEAAQKAATAVNETHDIMTQVNDKLQDTTIPATFTTLLATTASDETTMNNDVSSVFSAKNTLDSALATLGDTGSTPLDIQSAQLTLQKAQNAVEDAKETLADYFVTAPFSGTIAKVDVQVYDQASSGTTVATLITNDQYAELSLNEVDAAKVKDGQKVELTFDAIDGLTLAGTVAEVDSLGTVSSGVVTYDVKISFDTQDARVKPGMTVNATITSDSVADALMVPSGAITTVGNQSFVQVVTMGAAAPGGTSAGMATSSNGFNRSRFASTTQGFASSTASTTGRFGSSTGAAGGFARTAPTQTLDASNVTVTRVPVTIGISNDTETQIVSGLTEGELIVESTKTGTSATAAKTTTTGFGGGGAARGGFGGGGAAATFRAGG